MPKIKLSVTELKRLSNVLSKELNSKKAELNAIEKQIWNSEERKNHFRDLQETNIKNLEIIKEKIDSETFGKNE